MIQLVRFVVVGLGAMLVHWLAVSMLVPLGTPPLMANVVGFIIAFQVSYFGHRSWTFASKASHSDTFWRFLTVALLSFALNEAMYFLLLSFTGLNYRVALALVLAGVAALTFVLGKVWAFRTRS